MKRERLVRTMAAALLCVAASATLAAQTTPSSKLQPLPFDRILRYDEFTALLRSWVAARPNLVAMESIGKTPEGRDIWFLTLTNRATGGAPEKPAILVDGNMHATEWGGGVAALSAARGSGAEPRPLEGLPRFALCRGSADLPHPAAARRRRRRGLGRQAPGGPREIRGGAPRVRFPG